MNKFNIVRNHNISDERWRRTKRLKVIYQNEEIDKENIEVKLNKQRDRNNKAVDDILTFISKILNGTKKWL